MTSKELLIKWKEIANADKREYSEEELFLIKLKHRLVEALSESESGKSNTDKLEVTISYKEVEYE